jgi:hypothetical protein
VKSSRRGQRGETDGSYASNNPRLSAFMVLTLGSGEKMTCQAEVLAQLAECGITAVGPPLVGIG